MSVAEACSDFTTTIVYDNEFSARLSVASILRLRGAELTALSQDPNTDTALVFKLASRYLYIGNHPGHCTEGAGASPSPLEVASIAEGEQIHGCEWSNERDVDIKVDESSWIHPADDVINSFREQETVSDQLTDPVRSASGLTSDPQEVYLSGLIIHVVPQDRSFLAPLCNGLRYLEQPLGFQAYIADWKSFCDIDVSPSMFLDHLPWRCHYAMRCIIEARRAGNCTISESHIV